MNTTRTIATVLLAAFLVLGPVAAFAAGETVTVSTNASTYSGNATINVSGTVSPAPTAAGTAVVITTTGPMGAVDTNEAPVAATAGTYTYVLVAGGPGWTTGTYTVNATYGGPGGTGAATSTFTYTGASTSGVVTVTTTVTSTTTVGVQTTTVTATSSIINPDTTQLTAIQASLATIATDLTSLTSAVNTLQTGVTGLTTTLASITQGIAGVSGISGQLTTLNNGVNNDQTYVLVVAALAAITLVLELAILVRKLS
jgi:hypothetical protein